MTDDRQLPLHDDEPMEATLVFREQADGRKVARLPGGKVVLVRREDIDRVRDGESWNVKLLHRETFSIATAIERAVSGLDVDDRRVAIDLLKRLGHHAASLPRPGEGETG